MKKFLFCVIATMFLACAGNSDSPKQVADNSQEKAVDESLEKTTNEPLKKDSLTKIADDMLCLSIVCNQGNDGACQAEQEALSQKLSEEEYKEVQNLAGQKFAMFMKKMEEFQARREDRNVPPVLPSDCGECSDSLKKFVEDINNDSKLLLERERFERFEKMSLEDKKMFEKIIIRKIMESE